MKLKRNIYIENINEFLKEKHNIFFTKHDSINKDYDLKNRFEYKIKDDKIAAIINELFIKKFLENNTSFTLYEYVYIKLLTENKNFEKISKKFFVKLFHFYKNDASINSNINVKNELSKDYLYKLKLPNFSYKLITIEEINSEVEDFSFYLEFINIFKIYFTFFKYVEFFTILEFAELIKYDITLLILYCEVMLNCSNYTKEYLIKTIIKLFLQNSETNPNLLIILIALGLNYDNIDDFNQDIYYFKFYDYRFYLENYFQGKIHLLDFEDFSFIYTIIYSLSLVNDNKKVLIRNDFKNINETFNTLIYMIYMFKNNFKSEIIGPRNSIEKENFETIKSFIERIIDVCIYLDANHNSLGNSQDEDKITEGEGLNHNSYNIDIEFGKIKTLNVKLIFEKSKNFREMVVFYVKSVAKMIKTYVKNLNFNFEFKKNNGHCFSSEIILNQDRFTYNLSIDLYNLISKHGEELILCFEEFLNNSKLYTIPLKSKILEINIFTNSIEKIKDSLEKNIKNIEKLFEFNFEKIEYNIIINSDNGFETLEIILAELIQRINKNEMSFSIKLYEENKIYLIIDKALKKCIIHYPKYQRISDSLKDLINYLFSLISNVINSKHLVIDMNMGDFFNLEENFETLQFFEKTTINFFNAKDNFFFFSKSY